MSRIVTNVQSLVAQRVLGMQNSYLNQSLTRLSTGLRINSGKDDPAGLIASESLRARTVAISAAIDNSNRADNVLSVAEGSLQEINRLLLELEDLMDRSANSAGLSKPELEANQQQIDAIISSIDRVANTAEFNGNKLLGGAFDFSTSGAAIGNQITDVRVDAAKIPAGASRQVTVNVAEASEYAYISAVGGATNHSLSGAVTIQVRGNYGSEVFSFASGTTMAEIADAINTSTGLTGVSASVSGGGAGALYFVSSQYGADAMVSVEVLPSTGSFSLSKEDDAGKDGTVTINGTQASVNGLNASIRTGALAVTITMSDAFGTTSGGTQSFDITGGGAQFNIAPEVSLLGMETIGIQSVTSGSLGDSKAGYLSTLASGSANDIQSENFAVAQRVVRSAQEQISRLRGRIGAFQKDTLQTAINSLAVSLENTAAAESAIRETDFAESTSALTRAQILVQSSTATLKLANAQPQTVLSLLG
jgi:flagellin